MGGDDTVALGIVIVVVGGVKVSSLLPVFNATHSLTQTHV